VEQVVVRVLMQEEEELVLKVVLIVPEALVEQMLLEVIRLVLLVKLQELVVQKELEPPLGKVEVLEIILKQVQGRLVEVVDLEEEELVVLMELPV
jgi:hypothetical protein